MVKKVLSAVALASVFAAAPAMAQTGGFTGPGATQVGTVAQLKTLPDDAHLILKGNIVRNVQGDKYEFKVTSTSSRMPPAPSNLKSTVSIGTVRTSSPKTP